MKKSQFYKDSFSIFHVAILNKILAFLVKEKAKIKKIELSKNDEKRLKESLEGGSLITCNHPTDFDPPSLYCTFRKLNLEFRIMTARDVMFRAPYILRKLLQMGGCFSIDRTKLDRKSLSRSIEILSNRKNLIVFPEGRTYGDTERMLPYQPGPIKIALFSSKKTKSPIKVLPFAIYYSIIGNKQEVVENRFKELELMLDLKPRSSSDFQVRLAAITQSIIEKLEKREGIKPEKKRKWKIEDSRFSSINSRIKNLCQISIMNIESKIKIKPNKKDSLSNRIQKAREANDFTRNPKIKKEIEKRVLMLHSLSYLKFDDTFFCNTTYESLEEKLAMLLKELYRFMDKKYTIKTAKKCHLSLGEITELKHLKSADSIQSQKYEKKLLEKLEKNTAKTLRSLRKNNSTIVPDGW